ncbi:hypothetical protein DL96DRAFT_1603416 [Flagelloscypha sp. PMI_526]|nr:hypothetical protein DL96DRAFT_1603416 [Flagelloscypha sp. PMI_526]
MTSGSPVSQLQDQINALTSLSARITALRAIPPQLLRPPSYGIAGQACYMPDFGQFKEITTLVKSENIQNALKAANESQKSADLDAMTALSCVNQRKKRRLEEEPAESSPQPFKKASSPSSKKRTSLFPSSETPPLQRSQLSEYTRSFNKTHSSSCMQLKFWKPTRSKDERLGSTDNSLITLRFLIPNVLTAYINVTAESKREDQLLVECVTVFGSREKKASPHSQSDYTVFQALTQHVARMLKSDPTVSFQSLMDLMVSYQGLFFDKCKCERVMSLEGHVPAVAKVWLQDEETKVFGWTARHIGCR